MFINYYNNVKNIIAYSLKAIKNYLQPLVFNFFFMYSYIYMFNLVQMENLKINNNTQIIFYTVLILPFIFALSARFLGRFGLISLLVLSYCFLLCFLETTVFLNLTSNDIINSYVILGNWINTGNILLKWEFMLDNISLTMLIIVLLITFCVLLYSIGYLYFDPHLIRFLFYICLFSMFMVILISATNFVVLFMGWEGVGICSYLLISFWFTRLKAVKAALKAVVMNRIGDTGVLMAMVLAAVYFQTLNFSEILVLSQYNNIDSLHILLCHLICLCLFLGVIGKSAQMGLHTWLLLAMEGPTPASALIHAATMVTAGIFLMIRLSSLFNSAPGILILATFVGSITALFAGLCGLVQTDMKRIVAFSTTSQLGYMLLTCGLSHYNIAFFHLINHAFFKAMLFMTMGIVIHVINNEQDLRKTGSLLSIIPLVYTTMQIGNSALTGFVFTTGFFSKDLILEILILQHSFYIDSLVQQVALLTAVLTFLYSSRVMYYIFFNNNQIINKSSIHFANDMSYLFLSIALIPLLILSIIFGYFFRFLFIGPTNIYNNAVYISTNLTYFNDLINSTAELLPYYIKNLPGFLCILMCCLFLVNSEYYVISLIKQSQYNSYTAKIYNDTYNFLYNKWYSDKFFDKTFSKILHTGQSYIIEILERGFLDIFQSADKTSIKNISTKMNNFINTVENANAQVYIGFIILTFFTIFIIIN